MPTSLPTRTVREQCVGRAPAARALDAAILMAGKTLEADADIRRRHSGRRGQVSAHWWHRELHLQTPGQVDREPRGWLRRAWEFSA